MDSIILIVMFILSLIAMVKGADWFIESAEKIGLAMGMSPFVIGVVIVGIGTSFPEMISSLTAVFRGVPEIVVANVIGSNIANILLIVGASAVIGRTLSVTKNLIDLDLPLLAVTTMLFGAVAMDGTVAVAESIILLIAFGVYIAYSLLYRDGLAMEMEEGDMSLKNIPDRSERRHLETIHPHDIISRPALNLKVFAMLLVGLAGLIFGAQYLIESVVGISSVFAISAGVISLFAVAVGTSLPELLVSVRAALHKKSELALGNIFGSNAFNMLIVTAVPGLWGALPIDMQTLTYGLPMMIVATTLFIISGISRRIHVYEGGLYIVFYIFFIGKVFGLI